MYRGVIAFICLQLIALGVVAVSPRLVNYLPTRMSLLSETAPPPINPRLQSCLEANLFAEYEARESELRQAIGQARSLDMSYLPKSLRQATEAAVDKAERTFELRDDVRDAAATVAAAVEDYRPLHVEVRALQRDARRIEKEIAALELQRERLDVDDVQSGVRSAQLTEEIAAFQEELAMLRGGMPERWEAEHDAFRSTQQAEEKARQVYRRNVDEAYTPVRDLLAVIGSTDTLAALSDQLAALPAEVSAAEPELGAERVAAASTAMRAAEGVSKIRSLLSDARRALRAKQPDKAKALAVLEEAAQAYSAELAWRQRAKTELLPGLQAFEAAIRDTIGLRQQSQLPREKALAIVGCTARHRDISLYF